MRIHFLKTKNIILVLRYNIYNMNFPQKLETKRLYLRFFVKDDFKAFYKLISNEEIIKNFYIIDQIKEIKKVKELFDSLINPYNSLKSFLIIAITDKENENFIGFCGLKDLKRSSDVLTFYALLPEYRGFGYAIECMKKFFEYAFLRLELVKIVAFINPHYKTSWRVAERIGMKYMGHIKYKNFNPDPMFFVIEKKEFEAQQLY
ncbi:MAG: GNAT family N-acetyltransferase [Promethearchaeota archaeon]